MSATFLQAWRRRTDVRLADQTVLPWLYGVAANVVRNDARRRRRRSQAFARLAPPAEGSADFTDDLAGRLDDERRMREVLGLIERLPAPDQDVLSLCLWQGLSYQDVAVALDVPVGTVRSRLSRARQRLRELLAGPGHEEVETQQAQDEPRRRARDG